MGRSTKGVQLEGRMIKLTDSSFSIHNLELQTNQKIVPVAHYSGILILLVGLIDQNIRP